ncbi:hypothetical protein [Aeromonas phage 25AhydR2PP]|uniref:Uncharacterized protein n=1 Tax=Aeromonas phage 25AhydR2PP TaxID=2163976 RepID=A0A3G6V4H7_9CAUD|nr:hypothetical protein HOT20_gp27 [Aeromonas phage 25AhydR2PP]AZB48860.1 hypothetical protein [Aeromonas phage 25AhydR2PP]
MHLSKEEVKELLNLLEWAVESGCNTPADNYLMERIVEEHPDLA